MRSSVSTGILILFLLLLNNCSKCEPDSFITCDLSSVTATLDSASYYGDAVTFKKQVGVKNKNPLTDTTFMIQFDVAEVWVMDAAYLQGRCEDITSTELSNANVRFEIVQKNGALITLSSSVVNDSTTQYRLNYSHAPNDSTLIFGDITDTGTFSREVLSHLGNGGGTYSTDATDWFHGSLLNFSITHNYNHETQVYEGCGDGFLRMH